MTSTQPAPPLRQTALHDRHVALGARMVPFAGWSMPVHYPAGVIAEHRAVRQSAGLFDVSHMGQVRVYGDRAPDDLQRLLSNDISRIDVGQAQYTLLTNEGGGIEDDLIVYRFGEDDYLLVVNAANVHHDITLLQAGVSPGTKVIDRSDELAMLALQGPRALDVLAERLVDLHELPPFHFGTGRLGAEPVIVATTGYTGERGCELIVRPAGARRLWDLLLADERVEPAGLAARDTLRLEACYPLHGTDIDASTSAVSAGLSWVCAWQTAFVGRTALLEERAAGPRQRLVALRMVERGIPRAGCAVEVNGTVTGRVTSGTMSPTLGVGIALAYVDTAHAAEGTRVEVDVRGRRYAADVVKKPFYRKEDAAGE